MTSLQRKAASTSGDFRVSRPKSTTAVFMMPPRAAGKVKESVAPEVPKAILNYIRAMRSLGHSRINTIAISDALNIEHKDVVKVVRNLRSKGVKEL